MRKRKILSLIKLGIGIALIVALLSAVDMHVLLDRIRSADIRYIAIMFLLPHLGILLSTYKWQIFLSCTGNFFRLGRLFRLYLIGTFSSNFLPTMVGGDLVRTYILCRDSSEPAGVIAATFMERFIGLAALITFLPLMLNQSLIVGEFPAIGILVATIIAAFLVVTIFMLTTSFAQLERSFGKQRWLRKFVSLLVKTHVHIQRFRNHKGAVAKSYAISLLFYIVTIATTWVAAQSMLVDVDFLYLSAAVPVVLLAAFVPVSLNGLGVTEAGYVLFLQLAGVEFVDALGIALLLRARLLITAVIGGLVFLLYKPINSGSGWVPIPKA